LSYIPFGMPLPTDNPQNHYVRPGTRRLAGNTIWNLAGMCLPMVLALFAYPALIARLGDERYGLLLLIWMLVGYFSIFDLGLGRTLTKMVSSKLGLGTAQHTAEIPRLFWTAMLLMLGIGCLLMLLIGALTPMLAGHWLKIPEHLRNETLKAFSIVALGMPVVITTTGLIGMLESHQFFRQINCVRIPAGSFTFLGPLCVVQFTNYLPAVVATLIAGRLAETLAYLVLCLVKIPSLRTRPRPAWDLAGPMARFGGWLTVSSLIMPFMAHIDRFIIGSMVSAVSVAYYGTASEIVIRLLVFPRAWVSVLFPSFSAGAANKSGAGNTALLFSKGLRYLPGVLFPAALLIVTLAPEGLEIWLDKTYSLNSSGIMRLLTAGVFLNGLSYVPFSFLQGLGRPDLPAWLHLAELIIFMLILPLFIAKMGITGAAIAWMLRAGADLIALLWLAGRLAPATRPTSRRVLECAALCLALLGVAVIPDAFGLRCAAAAGALILFTAYYCIRVLTAVERQAIWNLVRQRLRRSI
jgi:O-antigen/teichoic acid export membrane protein